MPKQKPNNKLLLALGVAVVIGVIGLFTPVSNSDPFTKVAEKRLKSVVKVIVPIDGKRKIGGAGVLISRRGHILTAAHLFRMEHSTPMVQGTVTDQQFPIDILHLDKKNDIALVKVNVTATHYAPLARFGSVRVGQQIIIIGHPLQLDWSVSHGIISQLRKTSLYTQFNQTDAAMNPGNSGGPLFNLEGEVVGIASHGYNLSIFPVDSGLNMAASVDAIHIMLNQFRGL